MPETATRTAGHLIVRTLEAHGVTRVYGVPGESYLDVLDGLHDSSIETVVCRQEGGVGFMALAEGRLTGRAGIAMVTRGPGAANAMIAVHSAWQDATPLVLFVGLVPIADRHREAFQEFSLEGWFGTTAKRVMVVEDADRAGETVREALRIAESGRPGPVVVGLPEDVLVRTTESDVPTPSPAADLAPSQGQLDRLAELLSGSRRPALVVGGDGWHTGCGADLARAAEGAGLPVFADWRAYDAVPQDSAAYAGWLGYGRADAVAANYGRADLLVFVGCGRGDVLSDGYTLGLDTPTVLVTADPEGRAHSGRLDQHLVATPEAFTRAVVAAGTLDAADAVEDGWLASCADAQARFAAHRADASVTDLPEGPDLGLVFAALDERLQGRALVTFGAGNATIWAHRFVRHTTPASLMGSRNGAMGLSVPAAVAGSLIFPERDVAAVCGDGDFLMNGQEMATAFAHGATPLVLVVDNGIYGTIVQHQEKHYPGRPSGTRMVNPDFAAWIRSFGGHGELVETTDEFAPALDRALASGVPAVIHVRVSPEVMPPASSEIA